MFGCQDDNMDMFGIQDAACDSGALLDIVGSNKKKAKKTPDEITDAAAAKAARAIQKAESVVSKDSICRDLLKKIGMGSSLKAQLEATPFSADLALALDTAVKSVATVLTEIKQELGDKPDGDDLRTAHSKANKACVTFLETYDIANKRVKASSSGKSKA